MFQSRVCAGVPPRLVAERAAAVGVAEDRGGSASIPSRSTTSPIASIPARAIARGERSAPTGPRPSRFAIPTAPGQRDRAEQPAADLGGPRLAAREHLPDPHRGIGAAGPLADRRLSEPEQERVDRGDDPLVVVGRDAALGRRVERVGPDRGDPEDPLDHRDPESLERRDRQVAVEVVAVGRVDVVAEPDPRVRESRARACPSGRRARRTRRRAARRAARARARRRPRAPAGRATARSAGGRGCRGRPRPRRRRPPRRSPPAPAPARSRLSRERPVAELDDVAEQDEAVDAVERRRRAAPRIRSWRSRSTPLPAPRWRSEITAVRTTGSSQAPKPRLDSGRDLAARPRPPADPRADSRGCSAPARGASARSPGRPGSRRPPSAAPRTRSSARSRTRR